jgi:16S rRNA (cytosine967-C5)-methyltransferase
VSNQEPSTGDAGLPARQAAITLFEAALSHRGGLDEALSGAALKGLEPRDRAFARALTLAALRHLGPIDHALQGKLSRPPPERILTILRLGAAQAFWLNVPDHAAVASSVDLADRGKGTQRLKGLVNAVLRGLLRDGAPPETPDTLLPSWLAARWRAAYGEQALAGIAAAVTREPATDLTPRDPAQAEALAVELEATILPGPTLRSALRGDVALWPQFAEGRWWVQDAAAAIPARLLHVKQGESALDLCAAPGGKTLQLAAAGAEVTALDRSAPRLDRLRDNLARMNLTAEIVTAEGEAWRDERQFDAVLLDAPCTSTGTFRRHPDVLWASNPADIGKLSTIQARLLDSAAQRVKAGGRLVYCVCSLEPEEGESRIRAFLAARPDFATDPVQPGEGGAPEASLTPQGWLRILPQHCEGGMDGFFAARLVKKA